MDKLAIGKELLELITEWESTIKLKRQAAEKFAMNYSLGIDVSNGDQANMRNLIRARCEFYSASELEYVTQALRNKILLQDDELSKLITSANKTKQT